ncbi:MAG: cysteine desulfurase [Rickettsiaceae bacterium]|nr:cysteine desulfurase [Rickettsiaceae bacterium]
MSFVQKEADKLGGGIYLDYNATSPIREEVKSAMIEAMAFPYNPSSIHEFGRIAKAIVEESRSDVLSLVGIDRSKSEYSMVFVSSGTEANNLIMHNFNSGRVLVSAVEHMSILAHKEYKDNIDILPVHQNGMVDIHYLENWLKLNQGPKNLVSIMLANNETGIIQQLEEISKIIGSYGVLFHSDVVQAVGKIDINIPEMGVDFATISAHKFGGPLGIGGLIYNRKYHIIPQMIGGGQEMGARSGTQNVAAIKGFGVAAELAKNNVSSVVELRDMLESELLKIDPEIVIIGRDMARLPNTSLIIKPGVASSKQVISFDLRGVSVSAGAACSSGKVKPSHVLAAMGCSEELLNSAVRVSIGASTTEQDVVRFIDIWKEIYCT